MFAKYRQPPSFLQVLCIICAMSGVGLIVLGLTQDRSVLEKVGTALVMPSGLLWILLLTLSIHLCIQKKQDHAGQSGAVAAIVCFVVFSVAGNGFIANQMAAALQGNGSGDRLILAAQLYHQNIATKFICTGQRIKSMNSSGVDPAESSRDILLKLGVPNSEIEMAGGRNTSEEMQGLSARFRNSKLRIGLLTSAWHLPRAMRLAIRNGLQPIPLPADFHTAANNEGLTMGQMVESMIPNNFALGATCSFAKEYLAILLGR